MLRINHLRQTIQYTGKGSPITLARENRITQTVIDFLSLVYFSSSSITF
jgi:hypothetical protein